MIYSSKQLLQVLYKSYRASMPMYSKLMTISDEHTHIPINILRFINRTYDKFYSLSAYRDRVNAITLDPGRVVSQYYQNNHIYAIRVIGVYKCSNSGKKTFGACRYCPGHVLTLSEFTHCVGYEVLIENKYIDIVNIFTEQEIENLKKKFNIQVDYVDG